jgi:hypothetical protein
MPRTADRQRTPHDDARCLNLTSRRLVALFAVAALLFAMTLYGSHFHRADSKDTETTHCDLCIQFGGTGGPSAPPKLMARVALLVVGREAPANITRPLTREQSRSHRSRAPPFAA